MRRDEKIMAMLRERAAKAQREYEALWRDPATFLGSPELIAAGAVSRDTRTALAEAEALLAPKVRK